jgi:chorismate mutase
VILLLFSFRDQAREEKILNNVLRGFANTARKLLKKKIKGSFADSLQKHNKAEEKQAMKSNALFGC